MLYTITRVNYSNPLSPKLPSMEIEYSPTLSKEIDDRITRFLAKQETRISRIDSADRFLAPYLQKNIRQIYAINMSAETMSLVLTIAKHLQHFPAVQKHSSTPQRFKIKDLCSLTLHPISGTIWIHLKKKPTSCQLGKGAYSSFVRSLQVTTDRISLIAEGTFNSESSTIPKPPYQDLNKISDVVVTPKITCTYTGHVPLLLPNTHKISACKHCRIFPLYHCNLSDFLFQYTKWQSSTVWSLMYQTINSCLALHQNDLIHRDIKPSNYLVKFPIGKQGLEWNKPQVALGDIDMVIHRSLADKNWVGTPSYWPDDTSSLANQSFAADVHALGLTLKEISIYLPKEKDQAFAKHLIDYATTLEPNNLPTAQGLVDKLTTYLKDHYPKVVD